MATFKITLMIFFYFSHKIFQQHAIILLNLNNYFLMYSDMQSDVQWHFIVFNMQQ